MEVGAHLEKNAADIVALTARVGELHTALLELAGITSRLALAIEGKLTPAQLSALHNRAAEIMAKVGARLPGS
jgi:hypothetical protein